MKYRIRNTVSGELVDSVYIVMAKDGDIVEFSPYYGGGPHETSTLKVEMFAGFEDSNGVEVYEGDIIAEVDGQYWSVEFGSFGDHKFYAVNGITSSVALEEDCCAIISFSLKGAVPIYVEVIGVRYYDPRGGARKEVIKLN